MSERDDETANEQLVARLLRASGRGPTASAEARARVYATVHERWQASLRESAVDAPARPARPARGGMRMRWLALAAGVTAIAVVAYNLRAPAPAPALDYANVTKSTGSVDVIRDGDARRMRPGAPARVRVGDKLVTQAGGGVALRLDDGYVLRIAENSTLLLAAADRIDLDSGTVYFDSTLDGGDSPLDIATPFGVVRHIGTQFEANVDAARLRVRVREGVAVVRNPAGEVRAVAGEQVLLGAGSTERESFAPDDPAWRWAESLAALPAADSYSLGELVAWISRETGRTVAFDSDATRARAESIVLYELEGLAPRQVLDVIDSTTELDFTETEAGILLSPAGA